MLKYKKIFWCLMVLLVGIYIACIWNKEKEYVGRITTDELEAISVEVRGELSEKYKLNEYACYYRSSQIRLGFENFKEWEIRFAIKRICMQSENIQMILEKYQIKRYEVMDLFILKESEPIMNH